MLKGKNASFAVTFTINEDSTSAKAIVHGIIAGVPVPFPIPNPDACKDSGLTCPLKKGTQYTYTTQIFVRTEYPSIKLVVKYELQDQNSNDIFCVLIPVEIEASNSVRKLHNLWDYCQRLCLCYCLLISGRLIIVLCVVTFVSVYAVQYSWLGLSIYQFWFRNVTECVCVVPI